MLGSIALEAIEKNRGRMDALRMTIWENPEGPYREFHAASESVKALKEAGFTVEEGLYKMPTSFKAVYGSGKPVIGLLAEYDALPAMSQKVSTKREPINAGEYGQGCGHNLLGVGHIAAAIGMKAEMEAKGLSGTVVVYGCPGEELLTGKAFMAREGAFTDLDIAFAWHPFNINDVCLNTMTGINSVKFHFKGRTAHAGGDPHNGRSALDAVELTSVGANYLREHVTSDVRIHYVITNGGVAPNIVPDKASVWYYVRAMRRDAVEEVYKRLVKVAEGAAHMTETQLEVEFVGGCYPTLNNPTLCQVLLDSMNEVPQEPWTEEEIAFAKELNDDMPAVREANIKLSGAEPGSELHYGVMGMNTNNGYASTDVGDVCHIVPTATFNTACSSIGTPGHSWQFTCCSGHSIGEKGTNFAAKIMAHAGLRLIQNPELIDQSKVEFDKALGGKPYICPIPDEIPVP